MSRTDLIGTTNTMRDVEPLDASLSLAFLLDAERVARTLVLPGPPVAPEVGALREELGKMDKTAVADALTGCASVLVAAHPELDAILIAAKGRTQVRTADPQAAVDVITLVDHLLADPWIVPLLAASLRLMGGNEVKVGKISVKTRSVLQDLAAILHGTER